MSASANENGLADASASVSVSANENGLVGDAPPAEESSRGDRCDDNIQVVDRRGDLENEAVHPAEEGDVPAVEGEDSEIGDAHPAEEESDSSYEEFVESFTNPPS